MTYLRIKTIKGRRYLYRQTSVRKGKKVKTISEYLGFIFCAPLAAMSPGRPGGYSGHKSTDARANRHQDQANRERYEKEMQDPKARFAREAAKAAAVRSGRAGPIRAAAFEEDLRNMKDFGDSLKAGRGPDARESGK